MSIPKGTRELLPDRPDLPSKLPEELVERYQGLALDPPLQHGVLLAEHEVFQEKIPTATKEAKGRRRTRAKTGWDMGQR